MLTSQHSAGRGVGRGLPRHGCLLHWVLQSPRFPLLSVPGGSRRERGGRHGPGGGTQQPCSHAIGQSSGTWPPNRKEAGKCSLWGTEGRGARGVGTRAWGRQGTACRAAKQKVSRPTRVRDSAQGLREGRASGREQQRPESPGPRWDDAARGS